MDTPQPRTSGHRGGWTVEIPDGPDRAFTDQRQPTDDGSHPDGMHVDRFTPQDGTGGGTQVGSSPTEGDLHVSGGLFTTQRNFGNVSKATALWMSLDVRHDNPAGNCSALSPRPRLTVAPHTLHASSASSGWSLTENSDLA